MTTDSSAGGAELDARAILRQPDSPSAGGGDVMDAVSLTHDIVMNMTGDELGTIEAVMLDVPLGRVAYVVLSFHGKTDKLFAMPWSALSLDAENKRFVLDVSKEQLEAAPGFDRNHWPSMADREWAIQLHAYYDELPYWDDPLSASSG